MYDGVFMNVRTEVSSLIVDKLIEAVSNTDEQVAAGVDTVSGGWP